MADISRSRDGDLASGSLAETSVLHRFVVPQMACNGHAFSLEHSLTWVSVAMVSSVDGSLS